MIVLMFWKKTHFTLNSSEFLCFFFLLFNYFIRKFDILIHMINFSSHLFCKINILNVIIHLLQKFKIMSPFDWKSIIIYCTAFKRKIQKEICFKIYLPDLTMITKCNSTSVFFFFFSKTKRIISNELLLFKINQA